MYLFCRVAFFNPGGSRWVGRRPAAPDREKIKERETRLCAVCLANIDDSPLWVACLLLVLLFIFLVFAPEALPKPCLCMHEA